MRKREDAEMKRNKLLLIAAVYGVMFIFGFAENLKGMAVPPIRHEFGVDFSAIGIMIFCSSLGYFLACLAGGNALAGHIFDKNAAIMFPTAMAIVTREFKKGLSTLMGFIISMSAVINMIFNWIIGKINDLFGVYVGFSSLIIYAGLAIVCFSLFNITIKRGKLNNQQ
jgi:fucose permease